MTTYVVTCAPPNPNGDLHVGHLSGPFLGGDVQRRYLEQRGHDVAYVGYADDLSGYVRRRAGELGATPQATAHVFGRRIEETLALAGMLPDYFTHPLREPHHVEVVQRFFLELWERGAFRVDELPAFWCERCRRHLYEAEVRGRCQHCGASSDGFYCEDCGRPQDTTGLGSPRCIRCGETPAVRSLPRIVFPLDDQRDALAAHYDGRPVRPRLRTYLDDMLSRPLPDTTVSRLDDYGVPVPLPGWEGHILDTWYSGIWGYVGAALALGAALDRADEAAAAWRDDATRIVHFIGFDCSFSHALLWPALFLAHGGLHVPDHVVTNEFYRLDGEKFSTSRGHAVWGGEILRQVPADVLRWYLCLTGPETESTSFSMKEFADTVDTVLAGTLQGWVDAVFRLAAEDLGGAVPDEDPAPPLDALCAGLPDAMAAALEPEHLSLRAAAAAMADAVERAAAGVPDLAAARDGDPSRYRALLAGHLELVARVATTSAPLVPGWAAAVAGSLRLAPVDELRRILPWPEPGTRLLPPGHVIAPACSALLRPVQQ